jgi:membrane-bound lytic murein transglycosylase MltF
MKRILFICVVGCLMWGGVAAAEDTGRHPLDVHLSRPYRGDLPDLLDRRHIRVLTTMNRTNFFLVDGKIGGYEYALLKEYERSLNQDNKRRQLKVVFDFILVGRDRLLSGLAEGLGDIAAAGLTVTDQRRRIVDFTRPYLTGIDELLVTRKGIAPPARLEDLAGTEIFVRKNSSYYESLTALNRRFAKKGVHQIRIIEADEDLETEDILELVNAGAIDRTVCDSHIARIWSKVFRGIRIHENITFRKGGRIAWAVRKDSPKLKESLNRFIQDHDKGTLLGNIFFSRYYENSEWLKNPLNGVAGRKIDKYRPFFRKYARRYGFDWRLILAMAYQESGLDPARKSPRGAVGLMQIKPSTAADPNVDISNVDTVENNIHAAVKYLDFLRRRYFSSGDIQPRDRVRFTLAAYNAGPAAIRRAREKAAEMALDPNRWFRNVERAVLVMKGRETVRYVSNINKYYVIYTRAFERSTKRKKAKEEIQ